MKLPAKLNYVFDRLNKFKMKGWRIMPIYTDICKDCGERFELLIGVISGKTELKCRNCKSMNIEKVFSSFSIGTTSGKTGSSGSSCPTGTCSLD